MKMQNRLTIQNIIIHSIYKNYFRQMYPNKQYNLIGMFW